MHALVLLAKLPARNPTEFATVKDAYLIALEGVTAFGLEQATRAILRGSLGHAFMPSPPELRLECERMMRPARDRLMTQDRFRWADDEDRCAPLSEEARVRMADLWLRVRPMFEREPRKGDPPAPRTDEERMADLMAHAGDSIEVTETLKRKLGEQHAAGGKD